MLSLIRHRVARGLDLRRSLRWEVVGYEGLTLGMGVEWVVDEYG